MGMRIPNRIMDKIKDTMYPDVREWTEYFYGAETNEEYVRRGYYRTVSIYGIKKAESWQWTLLYTFGIDIMSLTYEEKATIKKHSMERR